jgi:hypothetical protein
MAIGLKTDEKNPADIKFYRSEIMPLPLALLKNPHLVEILRNALEVAEEGNRILFFASREFVIWFIAPVRGKADQEQYKSLFNHINSERYYWGSLEIPFRQFIQDLPVDPAAALQEWRERVISTARTAFQQATNSIDDPNRGLKAVVLARQSLERGLGRIKAKEVAPSKTR